MATYEHDGLFALFRYELESSILECIVFFKSQDQYKSTVLSKNSIQKFLDPRRTLIECHPLAFINVILELLQERFHQYARWRMILFDMESRLGVSRGSQNLKLGGYSAATHDYNLLNTGLASNSKKLADEI
jgi:hypothetical protein